MTDRKLNLREKFQKWWEGEHLPYPDSTPGSGIIMIGRGVHVRARSAVVTEAVLRWLAKNFWQLVTAIMGGIGLWIAYLKL